MKVKFGDKTEMEAVVVTGGSRYVQGASRDALSFVFPAEAGLEAVDAAFTPERCEHITIEDDEGGEYVHTGYTVRCELTKAAVEVSPATAEAEAVTEDRITVVMAQRTYAETQLAQLLATVAALQEE